MIFQDLNINDKFSFAVGNKNPTLNLIGKKLSEFSYRMAGLTRIIDSPKIKIIKFDKDTQLN